MEWEITFMVRGSDLEPQSLFISLLCLSSCSRHSSDFAVSVGLDGGGAAMGSTHTVAHHCCGCHKLPSLAGMIKLHPKDSLP